MTSEVMVFRLDRTPTAATHPPPARLSTRWIIDQEVPGMDGRHFDALIRSFDHFAPRRAALGLLGGGISALLGHFDLTDTEAKKKKRKKKKKCKGNKKKCGNKCISKDLCCKASECGTAYACQAGECVCLSGANDIPCTSSECCEAGTEICAVVGESVSCQEGGCPPTDYCSDPNLYVCGAFCDCVTSIDDATTGELTVCSDFFGECVECTTNEECTTLLDSEAICVPSGEFCTGCETSTFCIFADCPGNPVERDARASRARAKSLRRTR